MTTPIDMENIVRGIVSDLLAGKGAVVAPDGSTRNAPMNQKDDVKHVALGSDHASAASKDRLRTYLQMLGYAVEDLGSSDGERVDYPEIAIAVAKKVARGDCERGIMLDESGIGSSMACNKVRGVRAALCHDMRDAITSREHCNANVLALGGVFHGTGELCEIAKTWLETRFAGGEQWTRVNKIMAIERE